MESQMTPDCTGLRAIPPFLVSRFAEAERLQVQVPEILTEYSREMRRFFQGRFNDLPTLCGNAKILINRARVHAKKQGYLTLLMQLPTVRVFLIFNNQKLFQLESFDQRIARRVQRARREMDELLTKQKSGDFSRPRGNSRGRINSKSPAPKPDDHCQEEEPDWVALFKKKPIVM